MSNELRTHELLEALYAITSTAENLLSFCDHPYPEPLGDDWVGTIRSELEYGQSQSIDRIKDRKSTPILTRLSLDAGRITELINTVARDGRQLATLLHNRPELSTVRFDLWPPARQALYNTVFTAVRELALVRDRLAKADSEPEKVPFELMSGSQQLRALGRVARRQGLLGIARYSRGETLGGHTGALVVRTPPVAMKDGPEPPLKFWWKGEPIGFIKSQGQQWNVLNIMWPKFPGGKMLLEDFLDAWPGKIRANGAARTIRARLSETNGWIAKTLQIDRELKLLGDWICWVKKNSADPCNI